MMQTASDVENELNTMAQISLSEWPRIEAIRLLPPRQAFLHIYRDVEGNEIIVAVLACLFGYSMIEPTVTLLYSPTFLSLFIETQPAALAIFWLILFFIQLVGLLTGNLSWRRTSALFSLFVYGAIAAILFRDLGFSILAGVCAVMSFDGWWTLGRLKLKLLAIENAHPRTRQW
jgi:hypothetical protein